MLRTCQRRTFTGDRDKAILLSLLDTGCRRAEFFAPNVGDGNLSNGAVLVRHGKGNKPRTVFLGAKSRRVLVAYLRHRSESINAEPLWVTAHCTRLSSSALREVLRRRATRAGVSAPSPHSFRRAFSLLSLRSGMDIYSLQRLMDHSDLSMLRRYLAQTEEDIRREHEKRGPVDNML